MESKMICTFPKIGPVFRLSLILFSSILLKDVSIYRYEYS